MLNMQRRRRGRVAVKRMLGAKYTDPARFDQQFEAVVREVKTNIIDIDAKLVESNGRGERLVHYRNAHEFLKSPSVRARVQRAMKLRRLTEQESDVASDALRKHELSARMGVRVRNEKGRSLKEADFEYGLYPGRGDGAVEPAGVSDHRRRAAGAEQPAQQAAAVLRLSRRASQSLGSGDVQPHRQAHRADRRPVRARAGGRRAHRQPDAIRRRGTSSSSATGCGAAPSRR